MRKIDFYLYDDVDVLKNNLDITDKDVLERVEADLVKYRITLIRQNNFKINSVFDIKKIHNILFSTIFSWAGEFRKITMYKSEPILCGASVDYTPWDYIEPEMKELDKKFQSINWDEISEKEKLNEVCNIVQELWQIHCFREGNTRTVCMFLYLLLKTLNMNINVEFIGKNSMFFRNSLVLASLYSRSKSQFLRGIIEDCVTLTKPDDNKYQTIDGHDVSKYSYSCFTVEKMKTIKDIRDLENSK